MNKKKIKIKEICEISFPFCIMIQKSKFEIIENLIVQTYQNLNIIDDYCENQIYIKDNNDSFKL